MSKFITKLVSNESPNLVQPAANTWLGMSTDMRKTDAKLVAIGENYSPHCLIICTVWAYIRAMDIRQIKPFLGRFHWSTESAEYT